MKQITRHISTLACAAFGLAALLLTTSAHSQSPSTTRAHARDAAIASACHRQGPTITICRALVKGTHTANVPRRWAANPSMLKLLYHESSWNPRAVNKLPCSAGGNARGLFQFCNQTWLGVGCNDWRRHWRSALYQSTCGWRYVKQRYGRPSKALKHFRRHGWY